MHKRFVNQCTIDISILPCGPILIKSGKEGADPTKPDMEFVETYHAGGRSIYLPGSSLKGAIRAHAERIVRTVGRDRKPNNPNTLWASNPLNLDELKYLDSITDPREIYRQSSFTDQMFGNTAIASRIRIEDAYPVDSKQLKLEERNGVAIDRVFGSVIPGALFNYQVCTSGEFKTKIHLKNFSLAQLGLIGLVLRDLNEGWFGLGFAKSRGLGMVEIKLNSALVRYPGCVLENEQICSIGAQKQWPNNLLLGAGVFLEPDERERYGFPADDEQETPVIANSMPLGCGVELQWQGDVQVQDLFMRSVRSWRRRLEVV
ncbi:RAMP superfamily CRISPR-associated protein [Microseira sp. BLCC-F43]|jgi:CRISPR-associated RAMP protein (TIGR02581 family)|uniref:RAMP superfamily CRISPR-associated protein n=1 Tax=Microseira sp. BLCC-F43 TaxID=3153602 RepID=UPI0035BA3662